MCQYCAISKQKRPQEGLLTNTARKTHTETHTHTKTSVPTNLEPQKKNFIRPIKHDYLVHLILHTLNSLCMIYTQYTGCKVIEGFKIERVKIERFVIKIEFRLQVAGPWPTPSKCNLFPCNEASHTIAVLILLR